MGEPSVSNLEQSQTTDQLNYEQDQIEREAIATGRSNAREDGWLSGIMTFVFSLAFVGAVGLWDKAPWFDLLKMVAAASPICLAVSVYRGRKKYRSKIADHVNYALAMTVRTYAL